MRTYRGQCHCGDVELEVDVEPGLRLIDCNCSMCSRSGHIHVIVPKAQMRLLRGQDAQTSYRFNSGVAQHLFCRRCGIKVYYYPRSHPQGVSVNGRCLDGFVVEDFPVQPFDGANWEQHINEIT